MPKNSKRSRLAYSEFVASTARFYVRNPQCNRFKNEADKNNWNAAKFAFLSLSDKERDAVGKLYLWDEPFTDNINKYADESGVSVNDIWGIVKDFEQRVAKRRGLI